MSRPLKDILDDIADLPEGDVYTLHCKTEAGAIRFIVADSPESEWSLLNLAKELHDVMCEDAAIVSTSILREDMVLWQANTRRD